jgi:hypothetical protein
MDRVRAFWDRKGLPAMEAPQPLAPERSDIRLVTDPPPSPRFAQAPAQDRSATSA